MMNDIDERIQAVLHEIAALDPPDDDIAEATGQLKDALVHTFGESISASGAVKRLYEAAEAIFEVLTCRWPELGWEIYDASAEESLEQYQAWLTMKRKRNEVA